MKTPESYEKDAICAYLKSINCWYFRTFSAGFGKAGIPDIIACWRGKFLAIEVKREGKEPTVLQARMLREIEASGGAAFWGTAEKVIPELRDRFLI